MREFGATQATGVVLSSGMFNEVLVEISEIRAFMVAPRAEEQRLFGEEMRSQMLLRFECLHAVCLGTFKRSLGLVGMRVIF